MRFRIGGSAVIATLIMSAMVGFAAESIPRPEHPMPQMQRAEWLNLNGEWEFAETDESEDAQYLSDEAYPYKITVPFCRESSLSGLGRKGFVKNVWYRRTFERPSNWISSRTRLHIGASDWYTRVWINGRLAGEHKGGSAPIALDITDSVVHGTNTVIINVFDDTRSRLQALGKQSIALESSGCVYTRTTGIWQTVWLEGVGSAYIKDFHIQQDSSNCTVFVQAGIDGAMDGATLRAEVSSNGKVVGSATCQADWRNNRCVIPLSEMHLWSPTDPFLYDLKLSILKDDEIIDDVNSYFGLRTVSIKGAAILINGEPVFQRAILDQGFYPDGIWTAPSDAALKKDIELSIAAGFNGARLHQKVFEPRYLYWADKLGYLCWGEFPSWGPDYNKADCVLPIVNEWAELVKRDRNHPSIIGWCPFNESSGAHVVELQNTIVNITRQLDPSRPILDTSGWSRGISDPEVLDAHDYDQNPESFRSRWFDRYASLDSPASSNKAPLIPFFVSEFGGAGWERDDKVGWGYGAAPKDLEDFYNRFEGLVNALLDNRYMFGFCYTQLTDVEQEHNGLFYYDRTPKFDTAWLKRIVSRKAAYEIDPPFTW